MKILLTILIALPAGFLAAGEINIQTWDEISRAVRQNNPELRSATAGWRALQQRIPQAAAWEDLVVGVDMERSGTTNPGKYSDAEWMISQKIPLSGRNLVAGREARAEAGSAQFALRHKENQLLSEAAAAWYSLYSLEQRRQVLEQMKTLVDLSARSSAAMLETGQQSSSESLMILSKSAGLEAEKAILAASLEEQRIRLNRLMNRPTNSPVPTPAKDDLVPRGLTRTEIASAVAAHPMVKSAASMEDAARQRLVAAKRTWIPDPELRVEARHLEDSGKTFSSYDTGIFISVPWPNQKKYRAAIRQASEEVEKAHFEVASASLEIGAELQSLLAQCTAQRSRYLILRDRLMPLSATNIVSANDAYSAGRMSLTATLETRLQALELRAQLAEALAAHQTAIRQFKILAGLP